MPNYRPSGTDEWSSSGFQSAEEMQDAQSKDMDGQFLSGSLVDPLDFLEKYLKVDGHRSPVQPFNFSDASVDNEAIWVCYSKIISCLLVLIGITG